jgi:hypothetical protein
MQYEELKARGNVILKSFFDKNITMFGYVDSKIEALFIPISSPIFSLIPFKIDGQWRLKFNHYHFVLY